MRTGYTPLNPLSRGDLTEKSPLQRGVLKGRGVSPLQRGVLKGRGVSPLERGDSESRGVSPLERGVCLIPPLVGHLNLYDLGRIELYSKPTSGHKISTPARTTM